MQKSLILIAALLLNFILSAQEIERAKANLPEISEMRAFLDEATGWVLQENGHWLSEKNKIRLYNSEQNRLADPKQKLGRQNFNRFELYEVLIGDEQYIVFVIKYLGGVFEFPDLRQNFKESENARYVVFHAKKLEEVLASASNFNEPTAINLEVYCSDNIIDYDKKQLLSQIAYKISSVTKIGEPSKFTMILATMPVIVNGEKLFRFRYVELYNNESIYQKYLLPANKARHFERSYFEVPYTNFINFFGAIDVHKSDFDLQAPKNFTSLYKRGLLRYERKNYEGALSDFREALKLEPDTDFWLLYAYMGSTQHQLANYNAAIRSFEKAILLEPGEPQQKAAWIRNYFNRGLSHLKLNQKAEACADFQKAKSMGIDDEEALKVIRKNCKGKLK